MGKGREIRVFDYVNHPYEKVRDALSGEALEVFAAATKVAATRAESVASELRVNLGGIEVGTDIAIEVASTEEKERSATSTPVTRIQLQWEAAKLPRLFPFMMAELSVYPLTATETQLDLSGSYDPPLGLLGDAMDAVVGRHIAEASVHRFIRDVAEYLKQELA